MSSDAQSLFEAFALPEEIEYEVRDDTGAPAFRFTYVPLSYHDWQQVAVEVTYPDVKQYRSLDTKTGKPSPDATLPEYKAAVKAADDEVAFRRILRGLRKCEFFADGEYHEVVIPGDTITKQVEWLRNTRVKLIDALIRMLQTSALGAARRIEQLEDTFRQ